MIPESPVDEQILEGRRLHADPPSVNGVDGHSSPGAEEAERRVAEELREIAAEGFDADIAAMGRSPDALNAVHSSCRESCRRFIIVLFMKAWAVDEPFARSERRSPALRRDSFAKRARVRKLLRRFMNTFTSSHEYAPLHARPPRSAKAREQNAERGFQICAGTKQTIWRTAAAPARCRRFSCNTIPV